MPELDKELLEGQMTSVGVRNVQLNEKVSETTYQIIHPETSADQVITSALKRFVSDADKEKWDKCAADNQASLQYLGEYKDQTTYNKYDVVYYTTNVDVADTTEAMSMFYICVADGTVGVKPQYNSFTTSDAWVNLDFKSFLASRANAVRVDKSSASADLLIAFTSVNEDKYNSISVNDNFKFNPSTGTLTVKKVVAEEMEAGTFKGNLEGTADIATHYMDSSAEGEPVKTSIDATIQSLRKTIEGVQGGGSFTANALTITKDGENAVSFDGKDAITVDIKQTYTTREITDLLENGKIKESWLPDSILGQLTYQGVYDASQNSGKQAVKGDYYIVQVSGLYNPDGSEAAELYHVGDWSVYNGSSWDKVDNTDAVTMVNGQIGAVQTYKEWVALGKFYKGDIIKQSNVLYICNEDHTASATFSNDEGKWDLFGRTYTATDGIKLDGTVFKHDTVKPTASSKETTLAAGQSFQIPSFNTDEFGHVKSVETNTVTLGTDFVDTVREIKVNGETKLASNDKSALDIAASGHIEASYSNNRIQLSHKNNGTLGAVDLVSQKIENTLDGDDILYAGQGYLVPSFKIDGAGHVIAGEMKRFRLADNLLKHSHFEVKKDADGSQLIGAYDASTASAEWLATNALKFYLGDVDPVSESKMNFNGAFNAFKLLQKGKAVLDSSLSIKFGTKYNSTEELVANYDAVTNSYVAPDTGVAAGVYSAVAVNSKGLVTAAGHMVEFGSVENADPSDALVIGGLFFRAHSTKDANGA